MDGTSIVLGLVGLAIAGYAVDWWTKQARPPATNLRCANCPKLSVTIRRWQLATGFAAAVALVAGIAWAVKP